MRIRLIMMMFAICTFIIACSTIGCQIGREEPRELLERFTRAGSGNIISDNETGLQWIAFSGSRDWNSAESLISNLDGNWRMPTRSELLELYSAGINYWDWGFFGDDNEGSSMVWTSEFRDSFYVWIVDMNERTDNGDRSSEYRGNTWYGGRVFAVR